MEWCWFIVFPLLYWAPASRNDGVFTARLFDDNQILQQSRRRNGSGEFADSVLRSGGANVAVPSQQFI
jgi:hypothetical protein